MKTLSERIKDLDDVVLKNEGGGISVAREFYWRLSGFITFAGISGGKAEKSKAVWLVGYLEDVVKDREKRKSKNPLPTVLDGP